MKTILLPIFVLCSVFSAHAQENYWQQELHYKIDVTLNDNTHSVKGDLSLDYINHSPDTLTYIWFHIWPNAYRNDQTALAMQLRNGSSKKADIERGYIDSLNFSVNGQPAKTEPDSVNIDIIKVLLQQPLLPGATITVNTPFFVKLPGYYSRSGHQGQKYILCQWYPKPAVYDRKGWHPMPYLDQGEFYSDFGTYKVNISLPSAYVVGATGVLQTKNELDTYKRIGGENLRNTKKKELYKPLNADPTKTLQYYGENVHDFAWFADKEFIIQYDTLMLSAPAPVDVFSYYQPNGSREWANSVSFIKDAVRKYSGWIGEYPYPTVAAVEGPKNLSSGGMEYPMITLITSPDASKESLDAVITHEVGHNWFYGILASNERDHPWMDEGINTYYQFRYEADKYRYNSVFGNSIPKSLKSLPADEFLSRIFSGLNTLPAKEPIETQSTGFANKEDYGVVVYIKTAIWMAILESSIGRDNLDRGIQEYFNDWKFRHPYPEDIKTSFEKASGKKLDNLFELLKKTGNF